MPVVSQEYLDAKRTHIVRCALELFGQHGFQATTMRMIIAATGMSAGAVHHYFPSKRQLVVAGAEYVSVRLRLPAAVPDDGPIPDPAAMLAHVLRAASENREFGSLGVVVWGEAMVNPDLADALRSLVGELRSAIASLVPRWKAQGDIAPDASPEDVANVMYGLAAGFMLQRELLGDVSPDTYAAALRDLSRNSPQ